MQIKSTRFWPNFFTQHATLVWDRTVNKMNELNTSADLSSVFAYVNIKQGEQAIEHGVWFLTGKEEVDLIDYDYVYKLPLTIEVTEETIKTYKASLRPILLDWLRASGLGMRKQEFSSIPDL